MGAIHAARGAHSPGGAVVNVFGWICFLAIVGASVYRAVTYLRRGRTGRMMWTITGRHFWPLDALTEDVVLEDVARGLANECRYGGQCKFYSVAEHSVLVSIVVEKLAPPRVARRWALEALLHDGSEAYVGDVIRPLKYHWSYWYYRIMEQRVQRCVYRAFGIDPTRSSCALIAKVDGGIIVDEVPIVCGGVRAEELRRGQDIYKLGGGFDVGDQIKCLLPPDAERAWLERFEELRSYA